MGFLIYASGRAQQLLVVRVGSEQRSHIFLPKKIDELVPRQIFCDDKKFSRRR